MLGKTEQTSTYYERNVPYWLVHPGIQQQTVVLRIQINPLTLCIANHLHPPVYKLSSEAFQEPLQFRTIIIYFNV